VTRRYRDSEAVDFVVVGPLLYGVPPELAHSSDNVHFVGPMDRERLAGWLLAMDACIMPHRRDGLTASMDPLKLYEYLAAGRPVVSTIQSPNPALQPQVKVAGDANEFAAALEDELRSDSPERQARRRAAVEGHAWPQRIDFLLTLIDEALGRRATGAGSHSGGAA